MGKKFVPIPPEREKELILKCWNYQDEHRVMKLALGKAADRISNYGGAADYIMSLLIESARREIRESRENKTTKGEQK